MSIPQRLFDFLTRPAMAALFVLFLALFINAVFRG